MAVTRKHNLLIVDDEISKYERFIAALHKKGYKADTAINIREALNRLRDTRYDVVVIDIVLDNEDGFALLRLLRANKHTASIPTIMITGKVPGAASAKRSLQDGLTWYVEKPISISAFIKEVERILHYKECGETVFIVDESHVHRKRRAHSKDTIS